MRKAWLLLKASRTMIGENNRIALIIFSVIVWAFAVLSVLGVTWSLIFHMKDPHSQEFIVRALFQPACIVIGYGVARSIYTGFTEVKKESGKSNFRAWAIQLPVTKEDVIKAQFIDLLFCTLPAFAMVIYIILSAQFLEVSRAFEIYIGALVTLLSILFLGACLEKGLCTYFFISNRIREIYYVLIGLMGTWIIYIPDNILDNLQSFLNMTSWNGKNKEIYYIIQGLDFLGSLWGIAALLLAVGAGYFLSCSMPKKIYKLREGRV